MATETSMTKSVTLSRDAETYGVFLSFINDVNSALVAGQEVFISGNGIVTKRLLGSSFPAGIVTVGGAVGDLVTVHTPFQRTLKAHAKGGTLAAGVFVKPNGTLNADGKPEYVAAAPVLGDFVSAIVLKGGAVDTEIVLGILRTPIPLGAVS